MRGLVLWMCSQVSPMRSSAPGAKFSTSTSQYLIRRSRISLPLGCLLSIVIERLLPLSMVKYRLSAPFTSRNCPRVMSPAPGRSILMQSAPMKPRSCVQVGPDCTWVKSRMRTPSSARPAFPHGLVEGLGKPDAAAPATDLPPDRGFAALADFLTDFFAYVLADFLAAAFAGFRLVFLVAMVLPLA